MEAAPPPTPADPPDPPQRDRRLRAWLALGVGLLAAVGLFNPWNLVGVDRLLNHPFAASLVMAYLIMSSGWPSSGGRRQRTRWAS